MFARSLVHLLAVIAVGVWGFLAWPLPWPGVLIGVAVSLLAVLLWALFLSPKPVLAVDRFGGSLIELLLIGAAVAAALDLGVFWVIPAVLGVLGAVLGFITAGVRPARA